MRVRGQPTGIIDALGSNHGVPYYPDFDRIACQRFVAPPPEREDENFDKICNSAASCQRQSLSESRSRERERERGTEHPPFGAQDESGTAPLDAARFQCVMILGSVGHQEDVLAG